MDEDIYVVVSGGVPFYLMNDQGKSTGVLVVSGLIVHDMLKALPEDEAFKKLLEGVRLSAKQLGVTESLEEFVRSRKALGEVGYWALEADKSLTWLAFDSIAG